MTKDYTDNAIAAITDTWTGETREAPVHFHIPDTEEISDYLWSEGNYACDCNRGLFFSGESGECGESRYTVRITDKLTGDLLYEDAPQSETSSAK